MNLFVQLIAVTLVLILMFFITRGVIRMKIEYIVSKRERKRLSKNQSFKEWFFYKRYLNILPKSTLIWYYSNFVAYVISILSIIVLNSIGKADVGQNIIWAYFSLYGISLFFARIGISSK